MASMQEERTVRTGGEALWDTFSGLIRCRVLSVSGKSGQPSSGQRVKFVLLENKGPYRIGEVHETSGLHVCHRRSIIRGKYSTRIGYVWIESDQKGSV